jgi:hypothetical protein
MASVRQFMAGVIPLVADRIDDVTRSIVELDGHHFASIDRGSTMVVALWSRSHLDTV